MLEYFPLKNPEEIFLIAMDIMIDKKIPPSYDTRIKKFISSLPKHCATCNSKSWWKNIKTVSDSQKLTLKCGICQDIAYITNVIENISFI